MIVNGFIKNNGNDYKQISSGFCDGKWAEIGSNTDCQRASVALDKLDQDVFDGSYSQAPSGCVYGDFDTVENRLFYDSDENNTPASSSYKKLCRRKTTSYKMIYSGECTGSWEKITDKDVCEAAANRLGKHDQDAWEGSYCNSGGPSGCGYRKNDDSDKRLYFDDGSNNNTASSDYKEICQRRYKTISSGKCTGSWKKINNLESCNEASTILGKVDQIAWEGSYSGKPSGCVYRSESSASNRLYFDDDDNDKNASSSHKIICRKNNVNLETSGQRLLRRV